MGVQYLSHVIAGNVARAAEGGGGRKKLHSARIYFLVCGRNHFRPFVFSPDSIIFRNLGATTFVMNYSSVRSRSTY